MITEVINKEIHGTQKERKFTINLGKTHCNQLAQLTF